MREGTACVALKGTKNQLECTTANAEIPGGGAEQGAGGWPVLPGEGQPHRWVSGTSPASALLSACRPPSLPLPAPATTASTAETGTSSPKAALARVPGGEG